MTTDHPPAPHAGHETRDLNPRAVMIAGIILVVVLVLTAVGGWALLVYFTARETRLGPPASPLAKSYGRQVPPEPRLQADPLGDLRALRAEEDALLHGYGWVDREAGTVRIPIERAIELLAERSARPPGRGQP